MSGPRSRQVTAVTHRHSPSKPHFHFIEVPHVLFKFTTADENEGSIGECGSRCPQRRLLRQEYRRPEGGSHIQNRIFIRVFHAPLQGRHVA